MKNTFLALSLLTLIPAAYADVLVVISSSRGLFSREFRTDRGMELLGAELINLGIGTHYRKVYIHGEKDGMSVEDRLKLVASELRPAEKIDVFSMQHGRVSTPFIEVETEAAMKILPANSIRNVYNTACSEWGYIENNWKALASASAAEETLKAYALMNPDFYATHANNNSTGVLTLALLMTELRKDNNWPRGIDAAFKKFDGITADWYADLGAAMKDGSLEKALGDGISYRLADSMTAVTGSRVVLSSKKDIDVGPTWHRAVDEYGYHQIMPAPGTDVEAKLKSWCEYGFGWDCKYEMDGKAGGLKRLANKAMGFLHEAFVGLSVKGDGCVSPRFVNAFLETYFRTKDSSMEKLCMVKNHDGYRIRWEMENQFKIMKFAGIENLKAVHVSRKGSFHFINRSDEMEFRVNGLHFVVDQDVNGMKLGIAVRPVGMVFKDNGETQANIRVAGILPVGIGAESAQNLAFPEFIKLFGFKVWGEQR